MQYRTDLKEHVSNALSIGKLHHRVPQDHAQPNQFPSLPLLAVPPAPRQQTSPTTAVNTNKIGVDGITRVLLSINQNFLEMKDNYHDMDRKLDSITEKVDRLIPDVDL